jgi:hypothetical protein
MDCDVERNISKSDSCSDRQLQRQFAKDALLILTCIETFVDFRLVHGLEPTGFKTWWRLNFQGPYQVSID